MASISTSKFLLFKTSEAFEAAKTQISDGAIAFFYDGSDAQIYTHGYTFHCSVQDPDAFALKSTTITLTGMVTGNDLTYDLSNSSITFDLGLSDLEDFVVSGSVQSTITGAIEDLDSTFGSSTSESVITYLDIEDGKIDSTNSKSLSIDSTPTEDSTNLVTSGGVYSTIKDALNTATTALENLDFNADDSVISTTNAQPVVYIKQEDGQVTATTGNISSDYVEYGSSSTVTSALNTLQPSSNDGTINVTSSTSGTDYTVNTGSTLTVSSTGEINVNIDEYTIVSGTNGTLSVSEEALTQYDGANAITISNVDSNNTKAVSLVINSSDKLLTQDDSGLLGNLSVLTVTPSNASTYGVTLPETVKERQYLVGKDTSEESSVANSFGYIDIYYDTHLYSAVLGHQGDVFTDTSDTTTTGDPDTITDGSGNVSLRLIYYLDNGSYSLVLIDAQEFLAQATYGDGLQVTEDNVVSVKLDSSTSSEGYLYLDSTNGLGISGVNSAISEAIDEAIGGLDVESVGTSGSVLSIISEIDGKISTDPTTVQIDTTVASDPTTSGTSENLVTEGAVRSAITDAISNISGSTGTSGSVLETIEISDSGISSTSVSITSSVTSESESLITSGGVYSALDALDIDAVGGEGQVIIAVSEANGLVSATSVGVATTILSESDTGYSTYPLVSEALDWYEE